MIYVTRTKDRKSFSEWRIKFDNITPDVLWSFNMLHPFLMFQQSCITLVPHLKSMILVDTSIFSYYIDINKKLNNPAGMSYCSNNLRIKKIRSLKYIICVILQFRFDVSDVWKMNINFRRAVLFWIIFGKLFKTENFV